MGSLRSRGNPRANTTITVTEEKLLQEALQEKIYSAEKKISRLRLVLILFNSLVYLLFMQADQFSWLAYSVIGVANIYSLFSLVFEPYRKFSVLSNVYFTTVTDGLLITVWIMGTGFMSSPFYVIWYISLIAVAYRYSFKETVLAASAYLAMYLLVFALDSGNSVSADVLLVRLGYIPLAGMLGTYVSREISDQIDRKIQIIKGEVALKQAHRDLERKVAQRTRELSARTKELSLINKDLTDSINYAERIQTAILPSVSEFKQYFEDSFVLLLPKDIISGDFHWLHKRGSKTYLAVVDCTGHGVPGALMSMIGNNLLNSAILEKRIEDPGTALTEMDSVLAKLLRKDAHGLAVNDGMDMSLCVIDHETKTLSYAGAQGHGVLVQNGSLVDLEPTKFSIGGLLSGTNKKFSTGQFQFSEGDCLYLFTDGFQDQFGGPDGKKFYRKNITEMLVASCDRPMSDQGRLVKKTFIDWKGTEMQVDDVTVVGVRL